MTPLEEEIYKRAFSMMAEGVLRAQGRFPGVFFEMSVPFPASPMPINASELVGRYLMAAEVEIGCHPITDHNHNHNPAPDPTITLSADGVEEIVQEIERVSQELAQMKKTLDQVARAAMVYGPRETNKG
jgi:hypothetical protein